MTQRELFVGLDFYKRFSRVNFSNSLTSLKKRGLLCTKIGIVVFVLLKQIWSSFFEHQDYYYIWGAQKWLAMIKHSFGVEVVFFVENGQNLRLQTWQKLRQLLACNFTKKLINLDLSLWMKTLAYFVVPSSMLPLPILKETGPYVLTFPCKI